MNSAQWSRLPVLRLFCGLACVSLAAGVAPLHVHAADSAPVYGYRSRVGAVLRLDKQLADRAVREAAPALLKQVARPPRRPAELAPNTPVFATVDAASPDVPTKPKRAGMWHCGTNITLPVDASAYNRFRFWVYVEGAKFATLQTMVNSTEPVLNPRLHRKRQHVYQRQAVNGGVWTPMTIDLHHTSDAWRAAIKGWWIGASYAYPRPGESRKGFRVLLCGFRFERVENPRKWAGWEPDPQVITVNQFGYKPLSEKLALAAASHTPFTFQVLDTETDRKVLTGEFVKGRSDLGEFLIGDFSGLRRPGRYVIRSGELTSVSFPVAHRPYAPVAKACLHVLTGMRCGTATHFHPACHLDDFRDVENQRTVDMVGGYHDAADMLRQDHSQTSRQITWLMQTCRLLPDDDPLRKALIDEATWHFLILEKHVKHFGKIVTASGDKNTVTDNIPGTDDDRRLNGRSASSFMNIALMGIAELSYATRDSDPELSRRALDVIRANTKYMGYGGYGAGKSAAGCMAIARAAVSDEALREKAVAVGVQKGREIPKFQQNRVVQGSDPVFSGMFALKPDKSRYWEKAYEQVYQNAIIGLCALMDALPEHADWYGWYFAVRRYADFYVKSSYQYSAPYTMPVDLFPETDKAATAAVNTGGFSTYVGEIDGTRYWCPPTGHHLTSNTTLLATTRAAFAWMRAAAVLGDPAVENRALHLFGGTFLGYNAFNWTRIAGLSDDPCQTVWSYYRFVPGMVTCYPNLHFVNRTLPLAHINEIWTNTQTQAVMGCVALDAPCLVFGRITTSGIPHSGTARIVTLTGAPIADLRLDKDGRYGPVRIAGGGIVQVRAGDVRRPFAAVAGARCRIDLDIATDIRLELASLTTDGKKAPVRCGFRNLAPGRPATLRLRVTGFGQTASKHTLAAHAVNAVVEPRELTLDVPAAGTGFAEFAITPQNAGETLCVLVEIDGDHTRKWELSAVVTSD